MSRGNLVYAIADVTHDEKGYVADLTFALKFVVHRRPVYSCPLCNPDQVVGVGTIYAPRPKRLRKGGKSGRLKLAPSHGGQSKRLRCARHKLTFKLTGTEVYPWEYAESEAA